MKSISKFAYNPANFPGEVNSGEYLVEPDQTMTIREIFEKFKLGIPLDDIKRELPYNDTDKPVSYAVDEMDMMNELSNIKARWQRQKDMASHVNAVEVDKSISVEANKSAEKVVIPSPSENNNNA